MDLPEIKRRHFEQLPERALSSARQMGRYRDHAVSLMNMVIDAEQHPEAIDVQQLLAQPEVAVAYAQAVELFAAELAACPVQVEPGQRWGDTSRERTVIEVRHGFVISDNGEFVSCQPALDFVRGYTLLG